MLTDELETVCLVWVDYVVICEDTEDTRVARATKMDFRQTEFDLFSSRLRILKTLETLETRTFSSEGIKSW